jgi:hypothetical protein
VGQCAGQPPAQSPPPARSRRGGPAHRGRLALALAGGASGLAVSHLFVMALMVRPIGRLAAAVLITASLIVGVALGARTRHGRGRPERRGDRER